MNITTYRQFYLIILLLLSVTSTGFANERLGKYCGNDVAVYCANVAPGDGRIGRCLARQRHKLSVSCQAVVDTATHLIAHHLVGQCKSDIRRNCANVTPGNGRILRCLVSNYDDLTQRCAEITSKITGYIPEKHKDY